MKILKLHDDSIIPTYAHTDDVGLDLYSYVHEYLFPNQIKIIPTGIALEMVPTHWGLVRPRSGLATKKGIVLCSSGVIDPGYRGEIHVGLINQGVAAYHIRKGDRIAQLIVLPVVKPILEVVSALSESTRGDNGHGSTGF